jgi:cation diffusion facilitator CzcD-associated flavoprotein CzcO
MMSGGLGRDVCVIGGGGLGLAAAKNLLEQGFHVTVFEQASFIGGLWHATTDPNQTSVLPQSRAVLSKYSVRPVPPLQMLGIELMCARSVCLYRLSYEPW